MMTLRPEITGRAIEPLGGNAIGAAVAISIDHDLVHW
jgi:hypothetical protein